MQGIRLNNRELLELLFFIRDNENPDIQGLAEEVFGVGSGGIRHWFPTTAARDQYFVDNPDELRNNATVGVGDPVMAYTWNEEQIAWLPGAFAFKGQDGADGREIELYSSPTHMQWRYVGTSTWTNLKLWEDLRGPAGAAGQNGLTPHIGANGNWWIGTTDTGVTASGGSLSRNVTVTQAIPNIATGTILTQGMTLTDIVEKMFAPYTAPTFSAFNIVGQTSPLEVGASVLANRTFAATSSNPAGIEPNSIGIRNQTANTDIVTGLSYAQLPYTSTSPAVTRNTVGNNVWRIVAKSLQGQDITRDYTVQWYWRQFWGKSASTSLDEAGIKALANSVLAASAAGDRSFPASVASEFMYFVSTEPLTTFRDLNTQFTTNFNDLGQVAVTNDFGQTVNMYVYRSPNASSGAFTFRAS